jgi:C4-dicarboxylate-specific signal transduction histidine kinase
VSTTATLNIIETYNVHCCNTCGVSYAVTDAYEQRRRNDHNTFYCPNGHSQYYPQKNEAEKQRERADRLARQVEAREADIRLEQRRLENERRAHSATKGQLTKTKKRVANGVCPCCNRSFADLGRHMAGQHPDYAASQS